MELVHKHALILQLTANVVDKGGVHISEATQPMCLRPSEPASDYSRLLGTVR